MQLFDFESTDSLVERASIATSEYMDMRTEETKVIIKKIYKKLFEVFGNDKYAMISLISTMNSLAKCIKKNPNAVSLGADDAFEILYKCMKYQLPVDGEFAYFIPFKGKITFVLGYKGAELIYRRKHPDFCDINVKIITKKQYDAMNTNLIPKFTDEFPHIENNEITIDTVKFAVIKVTMFNLSEPIYECYDAKELLDRITERQLNSSDVWKKNFCAMITKTAKKKFFMEH